MKKIYKNVVFGESCWMGVGCPIRASNIPDYRLYNSKMMSSVTPSHHPPPDRLQHFSQIIHFASRSHLPFFGFIDKTCKCARCQWCLSRLVPCSAETPLVYGHFHVEIFFGSGRHCLNSHRFQEKMASGFFDI